MGSMKPALYYRLYYELFSENHLIRDGVALQFHRFYFLFIYRTTNSKKKAQIADVLFEHFTQTHNIWRTQ
jgi:hypothetical protein